MPDTGQNIVLTRDQIEQYLDHLRESGRRSPSTVAKGII